MLLLPILAVAAQRRVEVVEIDVLDYRPRGSFAKMKDVLIGKFSGFRGVTDGEKDEGRKEERVMDRIYVVKDMTDREGDVKMSEGVTNNKMSERVTNNKMSEGVTNNKMNENDELVKSDDLTDMVRHMGGNKPSLRIIPGGIGLVDGSVNNTQQNNTTNNLINKHNNRLTVSEYIKYIPTSAKLREYIINNKKVLGRNNKQRIGRISIYKREDGSYRDYFGNIKFNRMGGVFNKTEYVDESGLFEGQLFKNEKELINNSKMSLTGFFVDKETSAEMDNWNVLLIKDKIVKIANTLNIPLGQLLKRPMTRLPTAEDVIIYHRYPHKSEDVVNVCICSDKECNKSCKEIRKVERGNLHDVL